MSIATRRGATLPLKFPDYAALKAFVRDRYEPFPQELARPEEGYAPGATWALRGLPRFLRALRAIAGHAFPGGTLLDVGAYPGSFARLARAGFGDGLRVLACGMPVSGDFPERMRREGIPFAACNVDPDIVAPPALPVGLPYEDASINVVTCMEVVEHLYSLKTLFPEIRRVLAPGGVAYLTTNNIADRVGLLRAVRFQETNLDRDLGLTTIWSGHEDQWRGHVRFYSPGQLSEAAARAGLETARTGYFEEYEDPDVYIRHDRGIKGALRRRLIGNGESPPWRPKLALVSAYHLGLRSLSRRFDNRIEILLCRPRPVLALASA